MWCWRCASLYFQSQSAWNSAHVFWSIREKRRGTTRTRPHGAGLSHERNKAHSDQKGEDKPISHPFTCDSSSFCTEVEPTCSRGPRKDPYRDLATSSFPMPPPQQTRRSAAACLLLIAWTFISGDAATLRAQHQRMCEGLFQGAVVDGGWDLPMAVSKCVCTEVRITRRASAETRDLCSLSTKEREDGEEAGRRGDGGRRVPLKGRA